MSTRKMAAWASALRYEDLDAATVLKAKSVLFDCIGATLFTAGHKPWGKVVSQYAAADGGCQPDSQIIGSKTKTMASQAALANGTMAEGFELGDVHAPTATRPFPMIVPPALALVEARRRPGKVLVESIVAGYEINTRIGMATAPTQRARPMLGRGLYLPSLIGTFGAATAAGKALGLDEQRMTWALGIGGAFTGGYFQGHDEGAWTRRLNAGMTPSRGVTAALLAERGFVGPEQPLEGEYGFYRVFANNEYDADALVAGLGQSYKINDTWLKSYPMNTTLHAPVEALLQLMRAHRLAHGDIAKISATFHQYVPILAKKKVATPVSAQFSLPYALAVASVRGKTTVNEFTDETIADPTVSGMIDCIDVAFDATLGERVNFESCPGKVVVTTKDGRELSEEVLYPKGHPKNPMSQEELRRKFAGLAEGMLTKAEMDRVYEIVMSIEKAEDILPLMHLCSCPSMAAPAGGAN